MHLIHIGLTSSSEDKADLFYKDLLGLEKTRRSMLTEDLAGRLFGIDRGCDIVYYGCEGLLVEVFLTTQGKLAGSHIGHACIAVTDRARLLERCRALGFTAREAHKGESVVIFVEDADGNLFEIKEEP